MDIGRAALVTAGIGSCGMAVFQLYAPRLYGWEQYFSLIPPHVAWAMKAGSVFFSFLVAWGGFLTVLAGARRGPMGGLGYPILCGLAIFWIVNVLYQIRIPAPLPGNSGRVVLGCTIAIALLYIFFFLTRYVAASRTSTKASEWRSRAPVN
ncbi:MAG: hypothetical protein ACE14M_16670 [Terriglobales bacterium]